MASSEMLAFWSGYLDLIVDFLKSEPIIWFIGLYVGFFALSMIRYILHWNKV